MYTKLWLSEYIHIIVIEVIGKNKDISSVKGFTQIVFFMTKKLKQTTFSTRLNINQSKASPHFSLYGDTRSYFARNRSGRPGLKDPTKGHLIHCFSSGNPPLISAIIVSRFFWAESSKLCDVCSKNFHLKSRFPT